MVSYRAVQHLRKSPTRKSPTKKRTKRSRKGRGKTRAVRKRAASRSRRIRRKKSRKSRRGQRGGFRLFNTNIDSATGKMAPASPEHSASLPVGTFLYSDNTTRTTDGTLYTETQDITQSAPGTGLDLETIETTTAAVAPGPKTYGADDLTVKQGADGGVTYTEGTIGETAPLVHHVGASGKASFLKQHHIPTTASAIEEVKKRNQEKKQEAAKVAEKKKNAAATGRAAAHFHVGV
jgi:hypothetical protein